MLSLIEHFHLHHSADLHVCLTRQPCRRRHQPKKATTSKTQGPKAKGCWPPSVEDEGQHAAHRRIRRVWDTPPTSRKDFNFVINEHTIAVFWKPLAFFDNRSGRWPRVDASRPGKDRCVGSPLDIEISAKIPLRNFLVSANIPTGLDCAGLVWRSQLALVGIPCRWPRVEARPTHASASARSYSATTGTLRPSACGQGEGNHIVWARGCLHSLARASKSLNG